MKKKRNKSGRRQAIHLGGAFMFKRLFNVITPIILVRLLDVSAYGEYRFFWLVANTVLILAPLGLPKSLLYFMPRLTPAERTVFVSQTILWLMLTGVLAAIAVSPWSPLIPEPYSEHHGRTLVMSGFVLLWLVSSLIEVLPSADQRSSLQALLIVAITVARNLVVIVVALVTRDLDMIFLSLLTFVALKTIALLFYCSRFHGLKLFSFDYLSFRKQFTFAVPFGMSSLLDSVRSKVEQWMVAVLFVAGDFGIFAIALTIRNLLSMLRKSIGQVITPKMSKSELKTDYARALSLNNLGNVVVSAVVFPAVGFLLVAAEPIIEILYTATYLPAAPILKVYLLGVLLTAVEVSTLLVIFKQGNYVMKISAVAIFVSLALSYAGAQVMGMQGVAVGSVVTLLLIKLISFRRASELLDVPMRKLQNWKLLAILLSAAAAAALLIHFLWDWLSLSGSQLLLLPGAALIYTLTYLAAVTLAGHGRLLSAIAGRSSLKEYG